VTVYNYVWEFDTRASPEALWPRMADTNRFNRDTGIPALQERMIEQRGTDRRLGFSFWGISVEWEEEPFEWVRPYRYAVVRRYKGSPLREAMMRVELQPRADGGTHLIYSVRLVARNLLGALAIPVQVGLLTRRGVARAVQQYDAELSRDGELPPPRKNSALAPNGRARLDAAREMLSARGFAPEWIAKLFEVVEFGDELALARLRPYALADRWGVARRRVLELCLHATRAGVLDFEWDLLCPLCRGASYTAAALGKIEPQVHCDACNIDYRVNFERSVELSFHPNPTVREIDTRVYCLGGPQVTPHIFAQQRLPPHAQAMLVLPLEPGRYRVRTPLKRGGQFLSAAAQGASEALLRAEDADWSGEEPRVSLEPRLHLENATAQDQLFILERWAWSDQAATAADVTALQTFRDLFANEALRAGEKFSVGELTLVFTDLKRSTELYREIGDAPAFGRVLNHFEIVRNAVAAHEGAVVKTMGDAVMAVFRRPVNALRAMLEAQRALQNPSGDMQPLALKVGIHSGTCIAVSLNERLDYFGTTVNIAARIVSLAGGADILSSDAVWQDPEVAEWLRAQQDLRAESFETRLKGFDQPVVLWRIEETSKQ